jgi:hypothetical protein
LTALLLLSSGPAWALGYFGGSGNVAMALTGTTPLTTMASSTGQVFTVGDGTTAMNALTITQELSSGDGILAAKDIRVKIPALLNMAWDSSVTTATITGGASGKVSTTVSYANSDRTLVINATSDFADGDTITVSGLKFHNFTASGIDYLQLEIDNAGTTMDTDTNDKSIFVPERTAGFLGGDGLASAMSDIAQDARALGYLGGPGRNDALLLGASTTLMSFTSAAAQTFTVKDAATAASGITITQTTTVGTGVQTGTDLRLVIPSWLGMEWDSSVAWGALTVTGSAAGKVGGVSYSGGTTLVLDVTSNFADGETVTVSGLKFKNFTFGGEGNLQLDISGAGSVYENDLELKSVLAYTRAAGYLGGSGRTQAASGSGQNGRAYGYFGGSGRSDTLLPGGSTTLMSLASAAAQTFTVKDASTAASGITITQTTTVGTGVQTGTDLRLVIPSWLGMEWDSSVAWGALTVTGSAAGKVGGVSYSGGTTLVLDVTSNFADGETVTVSGLKFKDFAFAGQGHLQLDISGAGSVYENDLELKSVLAYTRSAGYLGGNGRAESESGVAQNARVYGYLGGSGHGSSFFLLSSRTLMSFTSAAAQTFTVKDAATAASGITITQTTTVGTGVQTGTDLRLVIPSWLGMEWDSSVAWGALTVTGSAAGKVGGVSYSGGTTLVLDVTSNFADGEAVTVSGLKFKDFAFSGQGYLQLDISGAGDVYEDDLLLKNIDGYTRTRGYLGGSGQGHSEWNIIMHPRVSGMGELF